MRMTKHARRRIRTRYNGDHAMLVALTRRIRKHLITPDPARVVRVAARGHRKTEYHVWLDPRWYRIIFDDYRKRIVTVLPKDTNVTTPP